MPKTDAARVILKLLNMQGLLKIHESVIRKIYENKTMRGGTIGGRVVAAIDGMELFSSEKKSCNDCLSRTHSNGHTEYFHRSVVCMTVGNDPHVILGEYMLRPRDGVEKDEGELTGSIKLINQLYRSFHHFADVIVADALYLNQSFINAVLSKKMDVVIRAKDETRVVIRDAEGLFASMNPSVFRHKKIESLAWDEKGFEMDGVKKKVRVLKFIEKHPNGEIKTMWVVTTDDTLDNKTIWEIMHKRWDIELNGFHQLKTYYHANHCFEHMAVEAIFMLNIMAFNLREMFFFRHLRNFREMKMTRCEVTVMLRDELLLNDYRLIFESG